jgi:hypothetical protein
MSAPAAFQGFYCDLRFVKTRSVAAITIEIPIEQAAAFVAAFGTPHPSAEIPVALARLDLSAKSPKAISAPPQSDGEPVERRKFGELPLVTQAGIVCGEPAFKKYIEETYNWGSEVDPANFVRKFCEVGSRKEIVGGTRAAERWAFLASAYMAWRGVLV